MASHHPTTQHNPTLDLFNNSKLNLDMSFNRNPLGRFACDIDPLSQHPFCPSPPTPTFGHSEPSEEQLTDALLDWKFPIRTDYARGLIWGPFKRCRGNSCSFDQDSSRQTTRSNHLFIDPSHQQPYSCDHTHDIPVIPHLSASADHPSPNTSQFELSEPNSPQSSLDGTLQQQPAPPRLQKIFPILRSPIVIRIKPLSVSSTSTTTSNPPCKRRRRSSRINSFKSGITSPEILHFARQSHQNKKGKFVQVAIKVHKSHPSRIKLCPTSRLKYGH